MVAFVAAFRFCYSSDSTAVCTRGLNFQRERIVKQIGFIFGTGVAGCKWSGLGVCRRRGGVAVNSGNHHGGGVSGSNFLWRLM